MFTADATLLSWIHAEVDQALKLVRENIAKFLSAREDEALLRVCPQHLHQVSGALRMVGLSGATRVCEAIEGSFGAALGDKPNPAAIGVIDRAVAALKDFVSELSRGQANMPLRLFPVYRELASLQGKADASERDLFFPDVARQAPPHASPKSVSAEERGAFVHAQRANFQRGLL